MKWNWKRHTHQNLKLKSKPLNKSTFLFLAKKWHWKGHTRQNLKLKSKPLNCTLKIHFGNVHAAQSNLLIHVALIVNLKYENALYKLIQAPMITSIFFKRSSLLLCQKTKIL